MSKVVGVEKEDNKFSIASCEFNKKGKYEELPNCQEVLSTFDFRERHYIIYVKSHVPTDDEVLQQGEVRYGTIVEKKKRGRKAKTTKSNGKSTK